MMTESEVVRLPTAVLKDTVTEKVGVLYSYFFQYRKYVLLVVLLIILLFLLKKVRTNNIGRKAKKIKPESTNTWFNWEDFKKWKDIQKE